MTRREELLLRSLIREAIDQNQINEFDIGNFLNKKTGDSAVDAAKKILDGHISGKIEKSSEILKKAYANLPPEEQKKYAAKIKQKSSSGVWDDDVEANRLER